MSNSYCISEPFSYAAIEKGCTLGLFIQIFNGSYDAGIDVDFLIVAHKALCHNLSKAFLKSMKHGRVSADAAGISRRGIQSRD